MEGSKKDSGDPFQKDEGVGGVALCYSDTASQGHLFANEFKVNPSEAHCFRLVDSLQMMQISIKPFFLRNALILCCMFLGEYESPGARAVLNRTSETWDSIIIDATTQLDQHNLPARFVGKDAEVSKLRVMSILRQLRRASCGGKNNLADCSAIAALSLKDILILCGWTFAVDAPVPRQFGECDPCKLQWALSKSRLFKVAPSPSPVEQWCLNLKKFLPIERPDWAEELEPMLGDECAMQDWAYLRRQLSVLSALLLTYYD